VVKVISQKGCIAAAHGRFKFSIMFARRHHVHPHLTRAPLDPRATEVHNPNDTLIG